MDFFSNVETSSNKNSFEISMNYINCYVLNSGILNIRCFGVKNQILNFGASQISGIHSAIHFQIQNFESSNFQNCDLKRIFIEFPKFLNLAHSKLRVLSESRLDF